MNLMARLRSNIVLLTFLGMYALTTVAGNLLYFTRAGADFAEASLLNFDIRNFPTSDVGYWILLFMPFVVAPPVALLVKHLVRRPVSGVVACIPGIGSRRYIVLCGIFYGYVVFSLYRAGVAGLFANGLTSSASLQARFELLAALGFWPQAALKSLLLFLSVYSVVQALLLRTKFWVSAAIFNIVAMTALLLMLNMKWPVVLFYCAIILCTIVVPTRLGLLIPAVASVFVVYGAATYFVTRLSSAQGLTASIMFGTFVSAAANRMALPYPYYYRTFTYEGQVCGTILDRLERKINPCQPSNLIYERVFGKDKFEGRGTAPAAAHITGYALGRWSGAFVAMYLASVLIGIFAAVPVVDAMSAAIVVMGALAGYHLSQLPLEAAIIYDHGILWWGLLVMGYAAYSRAARRRALSFTEPMCQNAPATSSQSASGARIGYAVADSVLIRLSPKG
jgi:hypothetical protein